MKIRLLQSAHLQEVQWKMVYHWHLTPIRLLQITPQNIGETNFFLIMYDGLVKRLHFSGKKFFGRQNSH